MCGCQEAETLSSGQEPLTAETAIAFKGERAACHEAFVPSMIECVSGVPSPLWGEGQGEGDLREGSREDTEVKRNRCIPTTLFEWLMDSAYF